MAVTVTQAGTGNSVSSGATLDVASVTASVGDMLYCIVAADNAGAAGIASVTGTMTDTAGNTWTDLGVTNRTNGGAANDGVTHRHWVCLVTVALTAGTVTANFSPDTLAKSALIWRVQRSVSTSELIVHSYSTADTLKGNGTSWSSGTIAGVPIGHVLFAATALEVNNQATADSDTTNGSWSSRYNSIADTGTALTSVTVTSQYKIATATGDQEYNAGTGANRDYALGWVIIYESVVGSFAITEAQDVAAFTATVENQVTFAITEAQDKAFFQVNVTAPVDNDSYAATLREAYAVAPADELVFNTIEIRHPSFLDEEGNPNSIFLVQDHEDLLATLEATAPLHGGEEVTFIAYAFDLTLAQILPDTIPEITLILDNVHPLIVENLDRAMVDGRKIIVVYRPYLLSDLSGPQMNPLPEFELSDIKVDMMRITAKATSPIDLRDKFPRQDYDAEKFPGLVGQ